MAVVKAVTAREWLAYLCGLAGQAHDETYPLGRQHPGSTHAAVRAQFERLLIERMAQAATAIVLELARRDLPTPEQETEMVRREEALREAEGQHTDDAEATGITYDCDYCHDGGWIPGGPETEDGTAQCPYCRPSPHAGGGYRG